MDATNKTNSKQHRSPFTKVFIWLIALIAINVLAYQIWFQLDLTQDKRYTINERTKEMLQDLKEPVLIKIFLTGDKLPSGFKRLANSAEELASSFRAYSNNKVEFQIIDPQFGDSALFVDLNRFSISSIPVTVAQGKGSTEQIPVTPYALVEQGDNKIPVLLQSYKTAQLTEADFDNSVVLLEYNLANAIRKVNKPHLDSVLYLLGNQQAAGYEVFQLANTLDAEYVFHVDTLQKMETIPEKYKTVIINKPLQGFSDMDQYKLDQYLMKGGNLLFCIEGTTASFDSLQSQVGFTAIPIETQLNNLLFTYGIRVNGNLVSDAERCVDIPLQHEDNSTEQSEFFRWVYFPILSPNPSHAITKNLNEVLGKFVSSLDLVNDNEAIQKTILLHTSNYTRIEATPLLIDITRSMIAPDRAEYNKKAVITGVLAEGTFHSIFENRMPASLTGLVPPPITISPATARVVVFSDGDIFNNDFSPKAGPKEMGTYAYSPYVFENRSLLLNTMEYLTDPHNLLEVRAKSYQASLLDKRRKESEATQWQIINIGVPALLVILFAIIFSFMRKRKYTGAQ